MSSILGIWTAEIEDIVMAEQVHKGAGAGRAQVALRTGHSLVDWIKLGNKYGQQLAGTAKRRPVTLEELQQHSDPNKGDVWMGLNGSVYNITPYIKFHPGGASELLRAAGIDGSDLFNEVHPWVNGTSMLEKCYIGPLVKSSRRRLNAPHGAQPMKSTGLTVPGLYVANPKPKRRPGKEAQSADVVREFTGPSIKVSSSEAVENDAVELKCPSRDWYQADNKVALIVYTKGLSQDDITYSVDGRTLQVSLVLKAGGYYKLLLTLDNDVVSHSLTIKPTLVNFTFEKANKDRWGKIGEVTSEAIEQKNKNKNETTDTSRVVSHEYLSYKLQDITDVTHDTRIYRFGTTSVSKGHEVCEIGQHVRVRATIEGQRVVRNYTPITRPLTDFPKPGVLDLLVKAYPDGAMSSYIASLTVEDSLDISGPVGRFPYVLTDFNHVGLIAGGTGCTPIMQTLRVCSQNKVQRTFLYCNRTEEDILMKKEIEDICDTKNVTHLISQPTGKCVGNIKKGRLDKEVISNTLPEPSKNILVVVCGRPTFTAAAMRHLDSLGYKNAHAFT